jgi:hypothetical protein
MTEHIRVFGVASDGIRQSFMGPGKTNPTPDQLLIVIDQKDQRWVADTSLVHYSNPRSYDAYELSPDGIVNGRNRTIFSEDAVRRAYDRWQRNRQDMQAPRPK